MSVATAIVPAVLAFNEEGVPLSAAYDDVYHSADGGLEQARHVFIGGNRLLERWGGREHFTVLETGFGLGLNFLATWQAWRRSEQRCQRLHFVSLEKHPFTRADLARLHQAWPELAELSAELLDNWPPLTTGAHRLLLDQGQVSLTLVFGDACDLLPKVVVNANALFLDGFAPSKNPDLWSPELIRALSRRCAPDATLATWSIASSLRSTLSKEAWQWERQPGFGRKPEMLTGQRHPAAALAQRKRVPLAQPRSAGTALVVGAGVAGCATAERLAARGWQVQILERREGPAREASGNPAGLMHPALSRDDNFMSRITRACALYGARLFQALEREALGLQWSPCGILQLARDEEQDAQQKETIEALGLPADFARYVSATEASELAGVPLSQGGWYYPGSGWLSPPTLCQALLDRWPARIHLKTGVDVAELRQENGHWQAVDAAGRVLAGADIAILASAIDILRQDPELPLTSIRGQVSLAPAEQVPPIRAALCGNGYLTPAVAGQHCFGATFDFGDNDPLPRPDGHRTNLGHLQALLPQVDIGTFDPERMQGRVGFRTASHDRLPLVGPFPDRQAFLADPLRREAQLGEIPRQNGLYCLTGLGSRGMVWAPLVAELLAAGISGEPLPLERELVDALDPARFLLRDQRKG